MIYRVCWAFAWNLFTWLLLLLLLECCWHSREILHCTRKSLPRKPCFKDVHLRGRREKCFKHAYPILNGFLSHLIGVPIKFDSWIKRKNEEQKHKKFTVTYTWARTRVFGNCLLKVPLALTSSRWLPEKTFFFMWTSADTKNKHCDFRTAKWKRQVGWAWYRLWA